jgi:hypothetical protein
LLALFWEYGLMFFSWAGLGQHNPLIYASHKIGMTDTPPGRTFYWLRWGLANFCLGQLQTMTLLIFSSWVAGSTDMSHHAQLTPCLPLTLL